MLGRAQAIANEPYQVYQGPMTAGESGLQSKVFQGLGNLAFPGNLGQSFASPMSNMGGNVRGGMPPYAAMGMGPVTQTEEMRNMARQLDHSDYPTGTPDYGNLSMGEISAQSSGSPGDMPPYAAMGMGPVTQTEEMRNMARQLDHSDYPTGIAGLQPPQTSQQPSSIAQSYMNPYLQSVLDPQMDELRRQNAITNMNTNAKLTQAGAFGGSRQAIMNSENNRNLMQEMNKTVGQGYANAYDKAMGQFNTEQGQAKDLTNMMANLGGAQRGIEQEGITADYNEFLTQRDDPMKKTQYLQSMLQGLPYQTVTNSKAPLSGLGQLSELGGTMDSLEDTLRTLGLLPPK
jgi:hypothetical protein